MDISIRRLAALARVALSQQEEKRLETDIAGVLAYADQLREVETEHSRHEVSEHWAAPEINRLREDRMPSSSDEDAASIITTLRDGFPEKEDDVLRVPLVIDKK